MHSIHAFAAEIARHVPGDGNFDTAIPRLGLIRSSSVTAPVHTLYEPSCCIVAQGRKRATVGDAAYVYDPANYLVVGVALPVIGAVIEASADAPYLCLRLAIDRHALADIVLHEAAPPRDGDAVGIAVATPALIDAAMRLLQLLDAPQDAAVLAPLVERELFYRLLRGPQGAILRQIAHGDSRLNRIQRSIAFICERFDESFAIDSLAQIAGMSPSSFHAHFRALTSMSPLQFRTQLRLQEARRLMVVEGATAADAGFRVGYESPSQFSREYARVHRASPRRDVERLRRR